MKKKLLFLMLSVLTLGAWAQSSPTVVVTDDVYSYQGTDTYVFSKAHGKVYVRNSVNEYEPYGVYEKVTGLSPINAMQTTPIEYISAPDGAYINLNYIPKSNTKIETVFKATEGSDWKALYGTRFEANTQNGVPFPGITNSYSAGNGWKPGFAFFTTNGAVNLGNEKVEKSKMIFGSKIKTIQDAATGKLEIYNGADLNNWANTIEDSPLQHDCATPLYIFAINKHLPVIEGYNTNPNAFGINSDYCYNPYVTLYSMKIYEGSTLMYDLVPVVADGKGGLYDKESGTVYTSANDKAFALSPDASVSGTTVYNGKMVFNTTDNKVYKYNGSEFVLSGNGNRTQTPISGTYQDMNNWVTNDGHMSIFREKWTTTANGYKIDPYVGTGGHEPLMIKVGTEINADYNYSFTASWGAYDSWHSVEMHAYVCNFWNLDTQESGLSVSNSVLATQTFAFAGGTNVPFSLDFTADREEQTLVFQFGDVNDGNSSFWFEFGNLSVKKYGYPEAYPVLNPFGPEIEDLLPQVAAFDRTTTTDAIAALLDAAVTTAQASLADPDDLAAQKEALENLEEKFELAKNNDVTILRATVALAKAEGVNTASFETFLEEGLDGTSDQLNKLRMDRKAAHMQIDNATYTGNAPAEGEFYIYNVGRKNYLTSGGDWGTHAVLGWPGLLATLAENGEGYTIQFNELKQGEARDKYLGKGPYVDASNGDKGTFVFEAVSGKSGVYHIKCTNNSRYLGYDVNGHVDGGGQRTFDIVTHDWVSADDNLDGEWMLVTKENRLAQMDNASTANPVDVTVLIRDASFNKYAALDDPWMNLNQDWEWGDRNFGDKNTETINSQEYDLSQTVTIPKAGYYELSVQSYYRDGSRDAHVSRVQAGDELVVAPNLYAGSVTQPIMYIHEEADKAPGEGTNTNIGNFPDNMRQASKFFENGLYKKSLRFVVDADNTEVKIGIKKGTGNRDDNWIVTDNFRLTYLGGTIPTESVTVGSLSYATYASDNALDFTGSSIKAFYATESAGTLSFTQVNKVPANTGVLLYADGGATVNVPLTGTTDDVTGNVFVRGKGAAVTYADNDQNYILFNGEDGIGFYKADNNTVATNRAYIHVENGNGVKGFVINLEDDATGISDLKDSKDLNDSKVIYNLAGQRLSKTQKGINIVNGKKILK